MSSTAAEPGRPAPATTAAPGLLWRLRKGTAGVKPLEDLAGPESPTAQDR